MVASSGLAGRDESGGATKTREEDGVERALERRTGEKREKRTQRANICTKEWQEW